MSFIQKAFLITEWTPGNPFAVSVLGKRTPALVPEHVSTVPTGLTGTANKHSLGPCRVPAAVPATVSSLEDKPARAIPFQRVRGKGVRDLKTSFPESSPWRESLAGEDARTSGIALKSFWEGGPVGNAWNALKLAPVQTPRTKKAFKGSPEGTIYMEIFSGAVQEIGRSPRLTGLFLFQPEDA